MKKIVSFLLFCCSLITQGQKPIQLKIESLHFFENEYNGRGFNISYSLSNLTDNTILFILKPDLIPIGAGSMNPKVYYKLYEKETSIDVSGIFNGKRIYREFKNEAEFKAYQDSIQKSFQEKTLDDLTATLKQDIRNAVVELQPRETKTFETELHWDKQRYHKNGDIEYYLSEIEPHFLELHINLLTEELLHDFTPEEKESFYRGRHFIKGWFTSNQVPINLKE